MAQHSLLDSTVFPCPETQYSLPEGTGNRSVPSTGPADAEKCVVSACRHTSRLPCRPHREEVLRPASHRHRHRHGGLRTYSPTVCALGLRPPCRRIGIGAGRPRWTGAAARLGIGRPASVSHRHRGTDPDARAGPMRKASEQLFGTLLDEALTAGPTATRRYGRHR